MAGMSQVFWRAVAAVAAALMMAVISLAHAHEIKPAIVTIDIGAKIAVTLRLNAEAIVAGIGAEHKDTDDAAEAASYKALRALPPEQLNARFGATASIWRDHPALTVGGRAVVLSVERIDIGPVGDTTLARRTVLHLTGPTPAGASSLIWTQPRSHGDAIVRVRLAGQDMIEGGWIKAGEASKAIPLQAAATSKLRMMLDYALIGFTHILPKGLDHILFVLGLYFLGSSWRDLLVQVTAFTLAHSVTLALGLYGVVEVSPRIVEPLIAVSIVYVAVENMLTERLTPWRPAIVFLFGLVHGMGFAGILRDADLQPASYLAALVAFNLGVELGQVAVIALAWMATGYWFRAKPWYRSRVVLPASVLIALCGVGWTIERLWFA